MPRPPYRSSSRSRKPADPILMGEPSPALSKISQMNTAKLRAYIQQTSVNAEQLKAKIEKLNKVEEPDEKRIAELTTQRQRLAVLIKTAADRLAGKLERAKQYQGGGGGGRGGGRRY